jgi:hypothetical protein
VITPPDAPAITSFSEDTGKVGDGITNDNTLTLKGTADANSTVTVYDGSTKVGTVTADASGAWSLTTSELADGSHSLTATATTPEGTSDASTTLTVTIDTEAPVAPTIAASTPTSDHVEVLIGTAEANSTVTIFDGETELGTVTADAQGIWSYTTEALSVGSHSFTAKATDAAGNTGTASSETTVTITSSSTAPVIASFSDDSGVPGDNITNDNTLTLTGTADANATVQVFDGTTEVGTVVADSNGTWSLTTAALKDGDHSFTAHVTDPSGQTSATSAALDVTIDTHAPDAPTVGLYLKDGSAVGDTTVLDDLIVKGTAEANSKVAIFDGDKQVSTVTADGNGSWSYDTGHLDKGNHSFTAKATDVAGNTSDSSETTTVAVKGQTVAPDITSFSRTGLHDVTIKGTADAGSLVMLFDGNKLIGTVKADGDGDWAFKASHLSNQVHTFKAQVFDDDGHVVSSGAAIFGSSRGDTLTGTTGNDIFIGNGHSDTFVFAADFGHDIIKDFTASGPGHDTIQFSKSVFSDFASVLNHASQVGQDVVITHGDDSLTLKNIKLGALHSSDFHFA